MAFFEDFTLVLKQKWLQYYQENKNWLVLHTQVAAVKTPDGGVRPPAYFILGVMSTLEPKLAQLMLPFSQLNPDADRLVEVLGLHFSPESSDAVATIAAQASASVQGLAPTPTEKPAPAKPKPAPTPKTPPTPLAVQEVLQESAPAVVIAESAPEANMDMEDAAVATATAVFGAAALDDKEEDSLKEDVWGEESKSFTEESTADEIEGFSESANDDLGDMGLDALEEESANDDLGDMGLDALEEESANDDLGGMDLEGLDADSSDDELGNLDLGGLDEDGDDDDLGDLDLGSLDDDTDDGLGDLDLDDLGGDIDSDDDTSDLLKGL